MQSRDILQGHKNVPVKLDVRHLCDQAERGQAPFLRFAAEEPQLNSLTNVFCSEIIHVVQCIAVGVARV